MDVATLAIFILLQFCDLATTLVFLRHGVNEANPLVSGLIRILVQPALAVLAVKLAGCGLALYAWRSRRIRLLTRANVFFGLCVAWNVVAIAGA